MTRAPPPDPARSMCNPAAPPPPSSSPAACATPPTSAMPPGPFPATPCPAAPPSLSAPARAGCPRPSCASSRARRAPSARCRPRTFLSACRPPAPNRARYVPLHLPTATLPPHRPFTSPLPAGPASSAAGPPPRCCARPLLLRQGRQRAAASAAPPQVVTATTTFSMTYLDASTNRGRRHLMATNSADPLTTDGGAMLSSVASAFKSSQRSASSVKASLIGVRAPLLSACLAAHLVSPQSNVRNATAQKKGAAGANTSYFPPFPFSSL